MKRSTRFQRLSGVFLIMTARVTCRACFELGRRRADSYVVDPTLAPKYGGATSARWQRKIVAEAVKHYRATHGMELPK